VTPDGIIHTVGASNGLTLTAEGALIPRFGLRDIRSIRRLFQHLDRDQTAPLTFIGGSPTATDPKSPDVVAEESDARLLGNQDRRRANIIFRDRFSFPL
jgi:hypothetical protein